MKFIFGILMFLLFTTQANADPRNILRDVLDYQTIAHWPDANGAMDRNKNGYIAVAFQKHALDIFHAGDERSADCLKDVGETGIDYGYSKIKPDGSFEGYYQGQELPFADQLNASAFFLQTASLSHYSRSMPEHLSAMDLAITWLGNNANALYLQDQHATNRLSIDAAAFIFTGKILNIPQLTSIGYQFLGVVFNLQTGGIFPENGGFDSSYQAVTILMLEYIWLNLPANERPSELYDAMADGIDWELTRIKPSGEVIAEGNTRTNGQEVFLGVPKTINYPQVVTALALWHEISGDQQARVAAEKVFDYMIEENNIDFELYVEQLENYLKTQCN
jgi:hypothetical protein